MKNRLGKLMEFNAQRLFMDQFFFPFGIVVVFWIVLYMWCIFIAWSNGRDTHINPKATTKKQINKLNVFFFAREHFSCRFYLFIVQSRQEMRNKWTIEAEGNTRCFFVDAASEK